MNAVETPPLGTVLLVTPYYPPHLGGVERYVQNLATSLLAYGHARRVVVVTTSLGGVAEGPVEGVAGLSVRLLDAGALISATPMPRRWYRSLRAIIAQEDPDLVNAHAPVPLLSDVTRLAARDRPFVLTYHAGRLLKGRFAVDLVLRAYEDGILRRTAANADAIISSSAYVRRTLGWRLPGPVNVVQPGVGPEWLAPIAGPAASRRALFVGTLKLETRYKGLADLLAALRLLNEQGRPLALDVVGDGDDRSRYESLADDLGLSALVRFHGAQHGDALIQTYRDSAMVVLPTLFDSTPTVLVEAMACARPVVSTRVGGVPELVVSGRTGLLVPAGDVPALARALDSLASDPGLSESYGRAARQWVEENLTWQRQSQRTVEVFRGAIARHRPRPTGPVRPADRRTRLAVVTAYYAPHIGGVETYTEQIVRAARASDDVDVMVITAAAGFRSHVELLDGTTVVRLGTWWRLSNTPLSPLWPLTVARQLRRFRIDVVNVHAPVPYLPDIALAVAGRRRTILTYHSGTMIKGSHWSDLPLGWYERHVLPRLFRRADQVVAVSNTSLAGRYPTARLISPGVDLRRFTPAEADPGVPTVVYVGRIERTSAWKGVDVLIAAFAAVRERLPQARLILVGGGDAIEDHRALAGRLGVAPAVTFAGPLTGADLLSAYQNASVVVLPSRTEAESFGLALIEAMACERPVIGSCIGGIPDVIEDEETGLLVSPGDPLALAEACLRVLEDDDLARRLARAGRRAVLARWSWEQSTSALLGLVRSDELGGDALSRDEPV